MTHLSDKATKESERIDTYWLWDRLAVRHVEYPFYRYRFLKSFIRADEVPRWVLDVFEKYGEAKI